MDATLEGDVVRVGTGGRKRFYDSRGYGRPHGDGLALAPVEAAHLLARGDLDAVDGRGLYEFLAATDATLPFVVYRDLRERGFYLSPAREGWVDDPRGADLVVYPRGKGPWDDEVAYRLCVRDERAPIPAAGLGDAAIAVVDEDGELTYFEPSRPDLSGRTTYEPPRTTGTLLADRVLVGDPPARLHERGFYGQRLHGRNADAGPLQLSLVEAAYLHDVETLELAGGGESGEGWSGSDERGSEDGSGSREGSDESGSGGHDAAFGAGSENGTGATLRERGRAVEGDRFDRRLQAYAALRDRGVVPKSGFKFGADFRAYAGFETVEEMGHSDYLVRVVPPDHVFEPRELSLDVRLAAGVRKRLVFALTGPDAVSWLSIERLTP